MNPRLKTSKKWTAFPKEYLSQIEEVFSDTFKKQLHGSQLLVEGRIYAEEVLLRVGIKEKDRLSQANFEVSMNYSTKTKDAVERIHDCIDAAASMMNDYFQGEGEVDFPRTWQEFEFNKRPLFLQFTTVNTDLEAQADAILGKSFEEMVQEDKDSEDALDAADENIEAEDIKEPSMFGGGKKKKKTKLHCPPSQSETASFWSKLKRSALFQSQPAPISSGDGINFEVFLRRSLGDLMKHSNHRFAMEQKLIFCLSLLFLCSVAFNNCSKVAVSDSKTSDSSVLGAGDAAPTDQGLPSDPPTPLATTCQNAKALGRLRTAHLKLSFPDPGKVCDWQVNGNLSIQDGLVRARRDQTQVVQIDSLGGSGKATLCNIQMSSPEVSNFYYDDNIILTLNGYVLASTTDFSAHFSKNNGYSLYDWSRLVNQPAQNNQSDSTPDKQYCAGKAQGLSACQFPETERTGAAQLAIGEKVIQDILGMTQANQATLTMITTGDNDSTDCQHVSIDLNIDADYIAE